MYLGNKVGLLVHCSFTYPGSPQVFGDPGTLSIVARA